MNYLSGYSDVPKRTDAGTFLGQLTLENLMKQWEIAWNENPQIFAPT